jgi:hypothetical protein
MSNENTIIVSTNSNYYYVSYNLGTTWSIFSLPVVIIYMYKKDYSIYGLGQDNNLYVLYTTYPGTIQIYGNDTNLLSYKNDSFFNFNILGYLSNGSYNLYALFVPDNNSYLSISSNILKIIVNQIPSIYTNYTLSGIINHGSTIKLYNRFSRDYLIEYNTNFIKYNKTSVINGQPLKIIMVNSNLGFICGTGGSVSRTLDGGLNWLNLNSISYYSTVNYQPVNIFAWDISNIIVAGGNRIHKSFDGGNNWIDISGVYNTSNYIVSGMMFIDETGIITFNNYTNCFRSINYGLTWSLYINLGHYINNF